MNIFLFSPGYILPFRNKTLLLSIKKEQIIFPDCKKKTIISKSSEKASGAAVQRCSVKNLFFKILQNSQENTCNT